MVYKKFMLKISPSLGESSSLYKIQIQWFKPGFKLNKNN